MSKSIRIRTIPGGGDKYVKVKLDQDFDFLEILSLKITQEDVYRKFGSSYGAVAGRVICNSGLGVPNVRISIFIPINDADKEDTLISTIYPYSNVSDLNSNGVRYNLLPNISQFKCHSPVGSMPTKEQVINDDIMVEVFDKYYKYSTVTNNAGDYIIFGVPVGNHILHMDADISDIGYLSQKPYDMIRNGSNIMQFDSPTKFKSGKNLDTLIQIKSSNTGINVRPFWGDTELNEVGISRADFDLAYYIEPSAIFIGSIFSDNEKNSINKSCRPRKNLGRICDTTTSSGTIEMIRKTPEGIIENFDIEGGRVIDDNGAWAYQVPMNLNHKITDEFGNLIESGDVTKGVATTAKVRFRISMDQGSGEGRLRTRASYLIPNNPVGDNPSDYTFDRNTSDGSLFELKWNKLYTVKNFISRYQSDKRADNKNFIGIKNVDDCESRTPFPFNRVDTDFNPLFTIICLIVVIISTLVSAINVIFLLLNETIDLLNRALEALVVPINWVTDKVCDLINGLGKLVNISCNIPELNIEIGLKIPCISLDCNGAKYSPGCLGASLTITENKAYSEGYVGEIYNDPTEFNDCISGQLGDTLNVFEFEFYNDWVNGSLYLPLLKYKKKRNDKVEKFCEYDCDEFDDNERKNKCSSSFIVDTCVGVAIIKGSDASTNTYGLSEGIVKKTDDGYFYYASVTHNNLAMYMTDIMVLGSIIDRDADGLPIIHESLVSTTYQMAESGNAADGDDDPEARLQPLFFDKINCFDFRVDPYNCRNINLACELGVELGANDLIQSLIPIDTDFTTQNDVNDSITRKYIIGMNSGNFVPSEYSSIDDRFSVMDYGTDRYYRSDNPYITDYYDYRDIGNIKSSPLRQPRGGSFYFYFGIIPGKSALEKVRSKFLTECELVTIPDFLIDGTVNNITAIGNSDASINIQIIGGAEPFLVSWYNITDPNNIITISENIEIIGNTDTVSNLGIGNYKVTTTEKNGYKLITEKTFSVKGLMSLRFNATGINTTTLGGNDGIIIVDSVYGGSPGYVTYIVSGDEYVVENGRYEFTGLTADTYSVSVKDSVDDIVVSGITISGPTLLSVTIEPTNCLCNDTDNGSILLKISGDTKPYTMLVSGSTGYSSTTFLSSNLSPGNYDIYVTGGTGQIFSDSITITNPPIITYTTVVDDILCYGGEGLITITGNGGTPPYSYTVDGYTWEITNEFIVLADTYHCNITDANGCLSVSETVIMEEPDIIENLSTLSLVPGSEKIILDAIGGTLPYSYYITPPSGPVVEIISSVPTEYSLVGLANGTYSVTVSDVNDCLVDNNIDFIY